MTVSGLLDRPTHTMASTDRLLGLSAGTARRWIDGYTRKGVQYPPVIRDEPTGNETVVWGEFVECRFLREYRKRVPMVRMRPALALLQQRLDTPYPLATSRPYVADREIVLRAQVEAELDAELYLVVVRNDQLILNAPAQAFYDDIEWSEEDGSALLIAPLGLDNVVRLDPLRGFGEPVVRNTRTSVLAELSAAGHTDEELADLYELPLSSVRDALRFEGRSSA